MSELHASLLNTPILAVALTLAAYLGGVRLFERLGRPSWCPAVLIGALLTAAALWLLRYEYIDYQRNVAWLTLLLGPATVALAVPLYQQRQHIFALWKPILCCLPLAAALAALYAVLIAWLLGTPPTVLASLAPKSVTAPIAMGILEQLGGSLSLMLGGLLITGVLTTIFVSLLAKWLKIDDKRILGFALGVNGHAIGIVRAFELGPTAGAFASLGMSLTGIFTAMLLPLVWRLLGV
ncbi:LrgB family protein [Halomonas sp. MCCC 1A11036]|uniref:LrgB family protein n=1 Tax=Billgrantia zhangzhouensis TaxID=2733481 RepID=A0ABS9ACJ1_9GAMM|nr:LrgB family protein [Halomonas zhangzhouensis]MCE8019302.1 LrgB family protein [Halomonas zhangzhouensis]